MRSPLSPTSPFKYKEVKSHKNKIKYQNHQSEHNPATLELGSKLKVCGGEWGEVSIDSINKEVIETNFDIGHLFFSL